MTIFKTIAAAAAVSVIATTSSAVTVDLTSVSGIWQNVVTAGGPAAGVGTNVISWGPQATPAGPSSYEFDAVSVPQNDVSSPFSLGKFFHNNFPVFLGNELLSADLKVSIGGTADGQAFNLNPVFSFTHFETPNGGNPCGAGGGQPCPDLVTLVNSQDLSEVLTLGNGDEFTLTILGFDTGDDNPLTSFLTKENKSNMAKLIATFEVEPGGTGGQVPLPAAGWMLLAGIGALGAAKRRKKKAS